jgi:MFS family permease
MVDARTSLPAVSTASAAAAPGRRLSAGPYGVLAILTLIYVINIMDRQLFATLQESIKADLNLSDLQLGLLGGAMFSVFFATAGLPLGYLADRWSRVKVIALSCAAWSVCTAACGLAGSFWQMALARIGVASGEAGGVSPSYSVLSDHFPPERRGFASGVFSAGAPVGLMLGAALGAAVAGAAGWRWAFIGIGLPGVLIALALLVFVRDRKPSDPGSDAASAPPRPLEAARFVWRTQSLRRIAFAAAATSFAGYALLQWVASFLIRTQHMTYDAIAYSFAPVLLLGAVGSFAGGYLVDRFGKTRPALYGLVPAAALLLAAPGFALAFLAPTGGMTIALMAAPYTLNFFWIAPALAAAQNIAPPATRATVVAVMAFLNNILGFSLGPVMIGAISDALAPALGPGEALRTALLIGCACYLPAAGLFLWAARALPRDMEAARAA